MSILSIQSQTVYGHVGNSAATFALQRLGYEVLSIPTVMFSNHPGHQGMRGATVEAELISDLAAGLAERGFLDDCEAGLSGYLGSPANGVAMIAAIERMRANAPDALYLCDPVIGDTGSGIYVDADLPAFFRDVALPAADIVTPNRFELEILSGRSIRTTADALAACDAVRVRGPAVVLCTTLDVPDRAPDQAHALAVDRDEAWLVSTPLLADPPHGAGDLFAAMVLAGIMELDDLPAALAQAAATTYGVLAHSVAQGASELLLIDAQDELVAPSWDPVLAKLR